MEEQEQFVFENKKTKLQNCKPINYYYIIDIQHKTITIPLVYITKTKKMHVIKVIVYISMKTQNRNYYLTFGLVS